MKNLTRTADYLSACLQQMGFIILRYGIRCNERGLADALRSKGKGEGLPLVAFRLDPKHKHQFDEFAVAHQLRERGWIVPAYTMAPHSEKLKLMRVVVREDFSRSRCDSLVADIKLAVETLKGMDQKKLEEHTSSVTSPCCVFVVTDAISSHVKKHATASGKSKHNHPAYKQEKHSLQGKSGKVCLYYHLGDGHITDCNRLMLFVRDLCH